MNNNSVEKYKEKFKGARGVRISIENKSIVTPNLLNKIWEYILSKNNAVREYLDTAKKTFFSRKMKAVWANYATKNKFTGKPMNKKVPGKMSFYFDKESQKYILVSAQNLNQ